MLGGSQAAPTPDNTGETLEGLELSGGGSLRQAIQHVPVSPIWGGKVCPGGICWGGHPQAQWGNSEIQEETEGMSGSRPEAEGALWPQLIRPGMH